MIGIIAAMGLSVSVPIIWGIEDLERNGTKYLDSCKREKKTQQIVSKYSDRSTFFCPEECLDLRLVITEIDPINHQLITGGVQIPTKMNHLLGLTKQIMGLKSKQCRYI